MSPNTHPLENIRMDYVYMTINKSDDGYTLRIYSNNVDFLGRRAVVVRVECDSMEKITAFILDHHNNVTLTGS